MTSSKLMLLLFLFITSCVGGGGGGGGGPSSENSSGEDSSSNNPNPTSTSSNTFAGVVIDGPIQGAIVCLDLNLNESCDSNEPVATTNENGVFEISINGVDKQKITPVIAQGGIDTATGNQYQGELKSVVNFNSDESIVINPLTDLITEAFFEDDFKDTVTVTLLKSDIANVLNLESNKIFDKPTENSKLFARAQQIEHLKKLALTAIFTKLPALSLDQKKEVRKIVTKKLMAQISEDAQSMSSQINTNAFIDKIVSSVVQSFGAFEITNNVKTFISNQFEEIKNTLAQVENHSETSQLNYIQAAIQAEVDSTYTAINNADSTTSIISVNITNDVNSLINLGVSLIQESVPEESAPEESAPEESAPEESTPEESTPEEITPEEITPEESTPEESTPEESSSNSEGETPPTINILTANAGTDRFTSSGALLLNANQSVDNEGNSLSYQWSVISSPSLSTTSFNDSNIVSPILYLDTYGDYIVKVIVSNGTDSATDTLNVSYQKAVEYTNSLASNSVSMISNHLINGGLSEISGNYYDTSYYSGHKTYKVDSNGVRVEKIDISTSDRTVDISNYSSSNKLYRSCIIENICVTGWQHVSDKDKLYIEKVDFLNKSASEHIITSSNSNENYSAKSIWNFYAKNSSLYIFRKLFRDQATSSQDLVDYEIIKLNSNLEVVWNKVYYTGHYGDAKTQGNVDNYRPYLTFEVYDNKIFLTNTPSVSRFKAEYIVIDDIDGSADNVVNYTVNENGVATTFQNFTLSKSASNELYFTGYYNSYSGSSYSTLNGIIFFKIDSSTLSPTGAKAVYSTDSNVNFYGYQISSKENFFHLNITDKTTGAPVNNQTARLYYDHLTPLSITKFNNISSHNWTMDYVNSFTNTQWSLNINGSYNDVTTIYTDIYQTAAHSLSQTSDKNLFTVKYDYWSGDAARSIIEVDNNGLHAGCFQQSQVDNAQSLSFSSKSLDVVKSTYTPPVAATRDISIISYNREVITTPIEERAPWLCSDYAMDLDKTIRVLAGGSINSHVDSEKFYTYTLITPPSKGTVTISAGNGNADLLTLGNKIITYSADPDASGNDSYVLRAYDGTGTKDITVTVEIK